METIVPISQDAFALANGENQIKVWNVKLNSIEQIQVKDSFEFLQIFFFFDDS